MHKRRPDSFYTALPILKTRARLSVFVQQRKVLAQRIIGTSRKQSYRDKQLSCSYIETWRNEISARVRILEESEQLEIVETLADEGTADPDYMICPSLLQP